MTPRSARIARVLLTRLHAAKREGAASQEADASEALAWREEIVFKVLLGEAISDPAVARRIAHALTGVRPGREPTRAETEELADLLDAHLPRT